MSIKTVINVTVAPAIAILIGLFLLTILGPSATGVAIILTAYFAYMVGFCTARIL